MIKSNEGKWLAAAAAILVGAAGAVHARQEAGQPMAQPAPAAQEAQGAAEIAPEAQAVFDRVRAFYPTLSGVQVAVEIAERETKEAGEENVTTMTISAGRPNKLAARTGGQAEVGYQLVSDGRTASQYIGERFNMYSVSPAPESFDELLAMSTFGEEPDPSALATNPPAFVLSLLTERPLETLLANAGKVTYGGVEQIDGVDHHKITIVAAQGGEFPRPNMDLWVADGEQPWIGRIAPDLTPIVEMLKTLGATDAFLPYVEIRFEEWQKQEEFPEATFAFVAPEGAEKVDSLLEAMIARSQEGGEEPANALLGAPAPAFQTEMLGGGIADLAAHKGKDVVVLDFWATWCPPCVKGLPIVSKVTGKYKDRNVVFYAVNVQEDQETIREFLKNRELTSLKVALDADGSLSEKYGVSGIPQTVIIDKQGVVQAVHVGLLPDTEEQLTREIETLLKGESLVKPEGGVVDDPREP